MSLTKPQGETCVKDAGGDVKGEGHGYGVLNRWIVMRGLTGSSALGRCCLSRRIRVLSSVVLDLIPSSNSITLEGSRYGLAHQGQRGTPSRASAAGLSGRRNICHIYGWLKCGMPSRGETMLEQRRRLVIAYSGCSPLSAFADQQGSFCARNPFTTEPAFLILPYSSSRCSAGRRLEFDPPQVLEGTNALRGEDEKLPMTPPHVHHFMSKEATKRTRIYLPTFVDTHRDDPVVGPNFVRELKKHFFVRIKRRPDLDEDSITDEDLADLEILGDAIYSHKIFRVNFTTYDLRREQDSSNVDSTSANFMLLADDGSTETDDEEEGPLFPYEFVRMIGAFHAYVTFIDRSGGQVLHEELEFLWVRWYDPDIKRKFGWKEKALPRIQFGASTFGFVDPNRIIRAVHLMPDFSSGKTNNHLGPTIARRPEEHDEDYKFYYVGIFVDRDTVMRFRGGGAGHVSTRQATDYFLADRDKVDLQFREAITSDAEGEIEATKPTDLQDELDVAGWAMTEDDPNNEEDELGPARYAERGGGQSDDEEEGDNEHIEEEADTGEGEESDDEGTEVDTEDEYGAVGLARP
ncbi:hypothetical protein NMY22_g2759 [Coprinellus aureogranulatus]|nr:hypothetical protein NMY22_g2759 [Coprinellus aureogranulatus]